MSQEEGAGAPESRPTESAQTEPVPAKSPAPRPAAPRPRPAKPAAVVAPTAPIVAALPAPDRSGPSAAELAREARRHRARTLLRALLVWVVLPTLLGVGYYGFVAPPEYESIATLVLTGGDAEQHAVLLREHMLSREALARLDATAELAVHYHDKGRIGTALAADAGSETRYGYFRDHVDARYESSSRIFTVNVRAFSGQVAEQAAAAWIAEGTSFVESAAATQSHWFIEAARPSRPTEATHPRRLRGMLTVFLTSLALFGIGSLLVAAIREHAQF